MGNTPRVDYVSGGTSVDRLSIWCTEQQPKEQHKGAMKDKVARGGDHGHGGCVLRGLTFDMRGGRKWAKPACGRPLDGRVRRLGHDPRLAFRAPSGKVTLGQEETVGSPP